MKKLILTFTLFVISANLLAQEYKQQLLSNEEFFRKADYIVELKWANIQSFSYDSKGNYNSDDIYTSSFWIINYVYKVDGLEKISVGDTIEIIGQGGEIVRQLDWTIEVISTTPEWGWREDDPNRPIEGVSNSIIFLRRNNLPENPKQIEKRNYKKVNLLQNKLGARLGFWGNGRITGLNGLDFPNRDSLFAYMQQYKKYGVSAKNYYDFWGKR
ncbi:MAG: hypothetical protein LBC89_04915, partial [Bacteroidales bacterium]|nr:hypothetical protein [Bacteroidales bacterium]